MGDKPNLALQRSLRALIHPLTITAVFLLLLNDHILRWNWPSWWTGKLGDFSWLVFFPFVLAPFFALIIPRRHPRQETIVAALAFGSTALLFASMKTIPAAHAAGVWLIEHSLDWSTHLLLDPTDLLMLPAVLVSVIIWTRSRRVDHRQAAHSWLILSLAALATIANTPAFPSGVDCIVEKDGTLIAINSTFGGREFKSSDGGLSWESDTTFIEYDENPYACPASDQRYDVWQISDPENNNIKYRFSTGDAIYRSEDGGQTWQREIRLRHTQAQDAYYRNTEAHFYNEYGPFDAHIHSETGNVVLAMGYEGTLVRTADGQWHWSATGFDSYASLHSLDEITSLLLVELILAAVVPILSMAVIAWFEGQGKVTKVLLGIVSVIHVSSWSLMVLIAPAMQFPDFGYGLILQFGILVIIISAPLTAVFAHIRIGELNRWATGRVWWRSIGGIGVFLFPYLLWSQGILPYYPLAMIFAVLLLGAYIYASRRSLRQFITTINTP